MNTPEGIFEKDLRARCETCSREGSHAKLFSKSKSMKMMVTGFIIKLMLFEPALTVGFIMMYVP